MAPSEIKNYLLSDPTVGELVRVGNRKQALKTTNKKLKKSPSDIALLITKASLLHQTREWESCATFCERLLERNPPVADIKVIKVLSAIYSSLAKWKPQLYSQRVERVWLSLMESEGSDQKAKVNIARQWAGASILLRQWSSMAKASGYVYKLLPEDDPARKRYFYWQIAGHWSARPKGKLKDDRLRNLGPQMALRMIKNAYAGSPAGTDLPAHSSGDGKSGPNWPSQRHELELMIAILYDQREKATIVEIVDKMNSGQFPRVIVDWQANRWKYHILRNWKMWADAALLCCSVIQKALDHDRTWVLESLEWWLNAVDASDNAEIETPKEKVDKMIHEVGPSLSLRAPSLSLRSPRKAAVKNRLHQLKRCGMGPAPYEQTLKAFKDAYGEYFQEYSHKQICFRDLDHFTPKLRAQGFIDMSRNKDRWIKDLYDHSEQTEACRFSHLLFFKCSMAEPTNGNFLWQADKAAWVIRELKNLELDYNYLREYYWRLKIDVLSVPGETIWREFIGTCLRAYKCSQTRDMKSSKTETEPGLGFLLLAVKALCALYSLSADWEQGANLKAACLLKFVLEGPKGDNSQSKFMFMNLCIRLGLYSQAFQTYATTKVKEILVEPCAALAFNRIAFLYPFGSDAFRPHDQVDKALKFYVDALDQVPIHQKTALEADNYDLLVDFDHFTSRLQNSPIRRMLITERMRIERITGAEASDDILGCSDYPPGPTPPEEDPSYFKFLDDHAVSGGFPALNPTQSRFRLFHQCVMEMAHVDSLKRDKMDAVYEHLSKTSELLEQPKILRMIGDPEVPLIRAIANLGQVFMHIRFLRPEYQLEDLQRHLDQIREHMDELRDDNDELLDEYDRNSDGGPFSYWLCFICFSEYEILLACFKMAGRALDMSKHHFKAGQNTMGISVKAKVVQKVAKERLRSMKNRMEEYIRRFEGLKASGRAVKWAIGDSNEGELGAEILDLIGQNDVMRSIDGFIESAKEGLRGVLKLELPEMAS